MLILPKTAVPPLLGLLGSFTTWKYPPSVLPSMLPCSRLLNSRTGLSAPLAEQMVIVVQGAGHAQRDRFA